MDEFLRAYGEAAKTAAGFFWKAGWAFALAVLDGLIVFGFAATG